MQSRIDAKFQFILSTLNHVHHLIDEDRYSYCQEVASNNEFDVGYDDLHRLFMAAESAFTKYYISFDQAIMYAVLKDVLYREFVLDKDGHKHKLSLLDHSNSLTKEVVIQYGSKVGLSAAQVEQVLPTLAFKLAKSEAKFILSSAKSKLFANVTDFTESFDEMKGKYEKRYGL